METNMEASQKTKSRTTYDPFLGKYQKECKSGYNKGMCTPMLIEVPFVIAKL
jgi:hypothetical protein